LVDTRVARSVEKLPNSTRARSTTSVLALNSPASRTRLSSRVRICWSRAVMVPATVLRFSRSEPMAWSRDARPDDSVARSSRAAPSRSALPARAPVMV